MSARDYSTVRFRVDSVAFESRFDEMYFIKSTFECPSVLRALSFQFCDPVFCFIVRKKIKIGFRKQNILVT